MRTRRATHWDVLIRKKTGSRVYFGAYGTRNEAERVRDQLRKLGTPRGN